MTPLAPVILIVEDEFLLRLDSAETISFFSEAFRGQCRRHALATPRLAPAIVFYVFYLAGIVVFVNGNARSNGAHSLSYGALFGLFYATFELTNLSVLKHWERAVVLPEIAWAPFSRR